MPADSLALAVTTGVGFSVVAGIISGVFYILAQGLAKKRSRTSSTTSTSSPNKKSQHLPPWRCCVCNSSFHNSEGILDVDRAVICMRCGRRVCRTRCSTRQPSHQRSKQDIDDACASRSGSVCSSTVSSSASRRESSGARRGDGSRIGPYDADGVCRDSKKWLCESCRQPEGWLRGLLRSVRPGKAEGGEQGNDDRISKNDSESRSTSEQIYDHTMEQQILERQEIRDFMERLICAMLSGDLDNVSVKRLYNDKKYLPVSGSSPCSAHAALKQLVQQFISDAAVLPLLKRAADRQLSARVDGNDESNRTYEDLLSAAIINKVIQNGQREKSKSSVVSSKSSSRASSSCRNRKRDELDLDNWPEDDASSVSSSLDEIMHRSVSSAGSTKYVDIETLTIRESPGIKFAEPNHHSNSSSLNHFSLGLENESLEDNWYLQKPGRSATASLVSVPILVPNPITDTEVLIDGKPVDANSDLSDFDSDDEEDVETGSSLGTILVDAKGIIGGKNILVEINQEDCDEFGQQIDRGTKPGSNTVLVDSKLIIGVNMDVDGAENDSGHEVVEATNGMLIEGTYDSSLLSLDSNTEQDTEYTERYASLPRTIEKRSFNRRKETDFHDLENLDSGVTSDVDDPCKDNLDHKEQNNDHSLLFGRDYYIKQASRSSGLRSTNMFEEAGDEITELDSPISPTNEINELVNLATSPLPIIDTIESQIESAPSLDNSGVFTAIPIAVTIEDPLEPTAKDEQTELDTSFSMDTSADISNVPTRPNGLDISSDSDYSMERTYNVMTGEVSKKGIEVVEDAKSPVGIKYIQNGFDEDESIRNEFLKKRSAIKTLICDEVPSSPEQIKEVKEMLEQEESIVPYESNNNNNQDVNNKNLLEVENQTPVSQISTDEIDGKDFSLEYSMTDHGDNQENIVDQPEIPDETLLHSNCQNKSINEPLINGPSEKIRLETNITHAGDSNAEIAEINIPSVKNLRKLFDSSNDIHKVDVNITKRLSTEVKVETKPDVFASDEPVRDIIIIENGKPEKEEKEKQEAPIFQSVKNLRKLFDKDNQQNMVNNSITARSISKQVQVQLKQDNTEY